MKGIFEELHYLTSIPALSGLEEKMIREILIYVMFSNFINFTVILI